MSSLLEHAAAAWWPWIASISAQVALLAVVLGLCERLVAHRAAAAVRSAFLWAVWLRLCLPPQLSSPVSFGLPDFLGSLGSAGFLGYPGSLGSGDALGSVGSGTSLGASAGGVPWSAGSPGTAVWTSALFLLWLAGAVGAAATAARRLARERTAWLSAARAPDARLTTAARRCAGRLGLARTPEVLVSAGASGPAAIGLLRPRVVLPERFASAAAAASLDHVLLHEFAHVARRDGLAACAWLLARILFWFHPFVHWTAARAATLREIGADERAAASADGLRSYRRTLLEHARPLLGPGASVHAGFVPSGAAILARLDALQRPARCSAAISRAAATATFAALAICCVPLGRRAPPRDAPLAELQGCLRQRYTVLAALARDAANPSTATSAPERNP